MTVTIVKPNPDEMFNTTKSFLLIEIHYTRSLQIFIFSLLLVSYLITLAGNILIVALTLNCPSLHTPMYFFVSNLSIVEICVTTTITPKFLSIVGFGNRAISYWGCVFQCYFYFVLASVDFFLLAVMSFDRYVAICQPLHYVTVMNHRVILYLAAGSWLCGFADTLPATILTFNLPFCGSNVIQHFFCDIDPFLKLDNIFDFIIMNGHVWIKLKAWFCDKMRTNMAQSSELTLGGLDLHLKSNFTPVVSESAIDAYITAVKSEVSQYKQSCDTNMFKSPNLTRLEIEAIEQLRNDPLLTVKPADKGGGIVVLDTAKYIAEIRRQLGDTEV
ncbi:olfactory receptor 6C75-like [Bufo gargarizans]|uniref:olfactory receptor 6C75-like n=1 Tax=Bufo gargarizans TaxID=30331 RepID=UPI001CF57290|nr:olfactory receptor 6C75-like [Bufo gargarizans]